MNTNKKQQDGPRGKSRSEEEERHRKQVLAAGMAGAGAVGAAAGVGAVLAGQEIRERRDTAAEDGDPSPVQIGDESSLDVFDALGRDRSIPVVTAPDASDASTPGAAQDNDPTPGVARVSDPTEALPDVFDDRNAMTGRRPVAQTRPGETRPEPTANVGETAAVIASTDAGNVTVPPAMRVTPQPATSPAPDPVVQAGPGPQATVAAPQTSIPVQPAQPTSSPESVPVAGDVQTSSPSNGAPPVVDAPVANPPSTDASSAAPSSSDTAAGVETVPSTPSGPSGPVDTSTASPSTGDSDSEPAPGEQPAPPFEEPSGYPQDHDDAPTPIYGEYDDDPVDADDVDDAQPPVDFGLDEEYGYPRVIAYNVAHGVVRVAINDEGFILEYHEDGSVYRVDEHGNLHGWTFGPGQAVSLLDIDHHGNARFETTDGTIYELDTHGNYEIVYDPVTDENPYEQEPPPVEDDIRYYFDEGHPHPADVYDQPDSIATANGATTEIYGGGVAVVTTLSDGNQTITWFITNNAGEIRIGPDGAPVVDLRVHVDANDGGYIVEVYPVDFFDDRIVDITLEGFEDYADPAELDMYYEMSLQSNEIRIQYEDESIKTIDRTDGTVRITYPDGTIIEENAAGVDTLLQVGDGADEPPEEQGDMPPVDEDEPGEEADGFDMADRGDIVAGDLQPIDSVIDLFGPQYEYLPAGAPEVFEYNGETYPNPEVDESFTYQYSTQVGAHYYTDESGYTIVILPNDDGTTTMIWGNPAANNGNWDMQMTVQSNGQYAPIEAFEAEPEAPPEYEYLPEGAPEAFEYNGETYVNPEADDGFTYQYSTQAGAHYYQDANGYTVVIVENDDGTTTMLWGNPVANNGQWDMSMIVQPDGQYAPTEAFEATPIVMEEYIVGTLNPDLFGDDAGILPENLPDYFVNENYPNPETDASYTLVSSETTATGLGTHRYADAEGDTITVSTSNGQPFQMAWADSAGNQNLIVSFNAGGEWTPSLYNPDEYTPPGQETPDAEPEAGSPAVDEPEDEPGLPLGWVEHPLYPNGVLTSETIDSGNFEERPDTQHVGGVGWVLEEDITPEDHTLLLHPMGYWRNDFLEDHVWTGVGWVAKDDIEEGVDNFAEGIGSILVTDPTEFQAQTAAEPADAPQIVALPSSPEFETPETPSIVPAHEDATPATDSAVQSNTSVDTAVTYPLVLDWGPGMESGWVRVAQADGNTYEYHAGDPTTYLVTDSGVVATNTPAPSLMHVGNDGAATFQHSSGNFYFQWNTAGGQVEVAEGALPFGVDEPYVEPETEQAEPEVIEAAPEVASSDEAPLDFEVTGEVDTTTAEPDESTGDTTNSFTTSVPAEPQAVEQPQVETYEVVQPSITVVEEPTYATAEVEQPELADSLETEVADDEDDGMP